MKSKKYIYKRHTTDFKISNVFLNYLTNKSFILDKNKFI